MSNRKALIPVKPNMWLIVPKKPPALKYANRLRQEAIPQEPLGIGGCAGKCQQTTI